VSAPGPRIGLASCTAVDPQFGDDPMVVAALVAAGVVADRPIWDDPSVDWDAYDLVVVRSTWDYTPRRDEFVAWAESLGDRLQNAPDVIAWNSDKTYLADLAGAGLAVVPTAFVSPGDPAPRLDGEVVVKPTVSAGAIDTGRFGPSTHGLARELVARIHATGRTAMVQPYLSSVDTVGETAVACLDGEPSHVLRKRAVLRPDEVAPVREGDIGAAEAMYEDDLVVGSTATGAELAFAAEVMRWVAARFGAPPLYARVDMVAADDGSPVLMELEAVEPYLYLDQSPGALDRLVDTILRRVT
jgi:hypothetical protein